MDNAWAPLVLDIVLVLTVLGRAARGWYVGLLAGGLGLVGLIGGAFAGLWAWPYLAGWLPETFDGLARSIVLVLLVLFASAIGQGLLGGLGQRLGSHGITAIHVVDRVLGAIGAAVVSVLVLGLLVAAVRPVVPASWAQVAARSHVVPVLEAVLPAPLHRAAAGITGVLEQAVFPRVFVSEIPEPVLPADQPDVDVTASPAVVAAADSVVRVTSIGCEGASTGSGWVSAPQRVVTNAHVVAGGEDLVVQVEGRGRPRPATLVAFDPDVDLAVLYVPGLDAEPLPTAGPLDDQTPVVVAGFPGGGPYVVEPGRVRGTIDAVGADIYGQPGVVREVYALYAELQQGNSGGPLLTTDGQVAGTVFAKSADDAQTGYALTDGQTDELVDAAAGVVDAVPSGSCVSR